MKRVRLALLGLGNVPLALLRYLEEQTIKNQLNQLGLDLVFTGAATERRGLALNPLGFKPAQLLAVGKAGNLAPLHRGPPVSGVADFIARAPADIFLECTPATDDGEPGITNIQLILARGAHVVTSNKSPLAWQGRQLEALAKKKGLQLRYGATVLAGVPPWQHWFHAIKDPDIREIELVVNATSNQILTLMLLQGKDFEAGVKEAQRLGLAERDPSRDTGGHDTQYKTVIVANTLMNASLTPRDVPTQGINEVSAEELRAAQNRGHFVHLLGRVWRDVGEAVHAEVKPTETSNPFFTSLQGTAMGLYFKTRRLGDFGLRLDLWPGERAILNTAAGVFEDILTVASFVKK